MNKETLEEAAKNYVNGIFDNGIPLAMQNIFKEGAKWQSEQDSNWFNEYQEVENYIINRIGDNFLEATPEKYETASQATIALLEANWQEGVLELLNLLQRSVEEINHIKYTYKDSGHCVKYLSDCEATIEKFKNKNYVL
jgi:hypothetical protein